MFLTDVPAGAAFRVVQVILAREVGKRLADMGFTEGAEGFVVRGGFMQGPLQVQIRGYDIMLRCCEASGVEIQPVGLWPVMDTPVRAFGRRWRSLAGVDRGAGPGMGGGHGTGSGGKHGWFGKRLGQGIGQGIGPGNCQGQTTSASRNRSL
jgi:Fe2+ transport system protein FeoA